MDRDAIGLAVQIQQLALAELDRNRISEGYALLEMAFTAAFAAGSRVSLAFKLRPRALLPQRLGSVDHVWLRLSRQAILLTAAADIVSSPLCSFERFPLIGDLLSRVALRLPEDGRFEVMIDLGDGDDRGDYPRIAYSSTRTDAVLIPDPYFYLHDNYDALRRHVADGALPWRQRRDLLFWRGSAAGPWLAPPDIGPPWRWERQQRLALCHRARQSRHRAQLDIGLSTHRQIENPAWQSAIEAADFLRPEVAKAQFLDYRLLIDIDGWSNSWTLLDKLISGATVLKVTSAPGFRQWYYPRLRPWQTIIPLAADLSDFDDVVGWALAHPEACAGIAAAGQDLAAGIQLGPELDAAAGRILALLQPTADG
jgi:hypothetical protein